MLPLFASEEERLTAFPVAKEKIFVAHAAVTALPASAANAMRDQIESGSNHHQEFGDVLRDIRKARKHAGEWIGCSADEIALLGPTSLGLSLFANGISWKEGDEILVYGDDYPANVYPWIEQQRRGAVIRWIRPEQQGRITPELIVASLTPRTRLVALASCHFLSGWRIDISAIGQLLRKRGILFSLDAIQTLGAFPTPSEHVDFLSADAHKWMLGPLAAGIVKVAASCFDLCRPTLLGAWNVESPDFIAQSEIRFVPTAQRYEPGVLNITGIYGMIAALQMLDAAGRERVTSSILSLRDHLHTRLHSMGWESVSPAITEPLRSGILTVRLPGTDPAAQFQKLEKAGIVASLRSDRTGTKWLRFSPHFYNTVEEMDRILNVLEG